MNHACSAVWYVIACARDVAKLKGADHYEATIWIPNCYIEGYISNVLVVDARRTPLLHSLHCSEV